MKRQFKFYTQYAQFYLSSAGKNFDITNQNTDPKTFKEDFNTRLIANENALIIFTQSYGKVKGEIALVEKPVQDADFSKYDHVVECGIKVGSGELQILSWPGVDNEMSIQLKAGNYRVRVYSSNFKSVIDDDGDDYYRIEVWPSDNMERKVLKQYNNPL
jgi:hypothetical protein